MLLEVLKLIYFARVIILLREVNMESAVHYILVTGLEKALQIFTLEFQLCVGCGSKQLTERLLFIVWTSDIHNFVAQKNWIEFHSKELD